MLRSYQQLLFSGFNDRPCETMQNGQILLLLCAEWQQTEYEFRVVPGLENPIEKNLPHAVIKKFPMFLNPL